MNKEELKHESDRKHAEREENRHKARTYKNKITKPRDKMYRCLGCSYLVPYPNTYCGECICEDDSL